MQSTILNASQSQKCKFRHDSTKIIFFQTFIYQKEIYYIAQCESRKVFMGKTTKGNFEICWTGEIKEKIRCIALMWKSSILCVGTYSGVIIAFDFMNSETLVENQFSWRIEKIDRSSIAGIVAYFDKNLKQRTIFSFTTEGLIRKHINQKPQKSISLPQEIYKFKNNKNPLKQGDFWCTFMIKDKFCPFILSLTTINSLVNKEISFEEYFSKLDYEVDQFSKNQNYSDEVEPRNICLSDSKNIVILVYSKKIAVYHIKYDNNIFKAYLDFQFEDQQILGADLHGSELAYSTESSIFMYDISTRRKISKKMSLKGGTHKYNLILWGKPKQFLLYGYINERSKVIFHHVKYLLAE